MPAVADALWAALFNAETTSVAVGMADDEDVLEDEPRRDAMMITRVQETRID